MFKERIRPDQVCDSPGGATTKSQLVLNISTVVMAFTS